MYKKIITALSVACLIFATTYSTDAWSKRGSSSSSSFKSRPHSAPKPAARPAAKPAPKPTANRPDQRPQSGHTPHNSQRQQPATPTTRQEVAKAPTTTRQEYGANVQRQQQVATSRAAYQQQQQAFTKQRPATAVASTTNRTTAAGSNTPTRPTTTTGDTRSQTTVVNRTTIINNPVVSRSSNYDRTTYHTRRSSYYGSWSTPSYVYHGYPSYGIWDSLALWYMLDNINDAKYRNMYYHQMNTPGMAEWRREAESLARDNADLRQKLNNLDSGVKELERNGVARDESYLPPGAQADLFLAAEVLEETTPVLRMCTGPNDRNYYNVARMLSSNIQNVRIEPITTMGSEQNLIDMEAGKCDAAFVQRDAYWNHQEINPKSTLDFERIASPYSEVVHMVCTESSGVTKLSELTSNHTILVGEPGSGGAVTWKNVVSEVPQYSSVKTLPVGGALAKSRVSTGQADCMLMVSGLNTDFMRDMQNIGKTVKLNLVNWNDGRVLKSLDPANQPVYTQYTLPSKTYQSLQLDSWFRYFNTSTDVITVPADIVVNNTWAKDNNAPFERLVSEVATRTNQIQQYVGAQ